MKKGAAWAAVVALAVLPTACGSSSDTGAPTPAGRPKQATVTLRDIAFDPDQVTVKAGDTVTWKFEDQGISHDVEADDGSFKSEVQDSGTFRHTFDAPGTYSYKCSLHPVQMTGAVVVR